MSVTRTILGSESIVTAMHCCPVKEILHSSCGIPDPTVRPHLSSKPEPCGIISHDIALAANLARARGAGGRARLMAVNAIASVYAVRAWLWITRCVMHSHLLHAARLPASGTGHVTRCANTTALFRVRPHRICWRFLRRVPRWTVISCEEGELLRFDELVRNL